jgi:hypothetical protein
LKYTLNTVVPSPFNAESDNTFAGVTEASPVYAQPGVWAESGVLSNVVTDTNWSVVPVLASEDDAVEDHAPFARF